MTGIFNIDFAKLDLRDGLDLAILIEKEAYERYREFADQMGSRYKGDAGDVFTMMAENEAKHGRQLRDERRRLFGDAPTRLSMDQIDEIEAPAYAKSRAFMSPGQALQVAIECEAKAQRFFEEALKIVRDAALRKLFTELRDEEIEHQNLLRAAMERVDPSMRPDREDDEIEDPPGL